MVDEDATSHNRYIERFRARDTSETVVKRLRRIAKKKNGLEFPINLTARVSAAIARQLRRRLTARRRRSRRRARARTWCCRATSKT